MDFIFAKVTNSRLMGSLGLIIAWKYNDVRLNQYFLLDAEGLGIADYVGIKNGDEDLLYREEERLMGGLGSDRIFISKEEALYLVNYFGNKTIRYEKELPGNIDEYYFILETSIDTIEFENIFKKICKIIETPIEFINYMTMRFIARDKEALDFFSLNKEISNMCVTSINGVLLRNNVTRLNENQYSCECIFEDKDGYYKTKLGFNIDTLEEYKIRSLMVSSTKRIDSEYVLNEIKKTEYISIFKTKNADNFIDMFHEKNPYCMRSDFEKGVLFTQFKSNNNHVKNKIYFISEDIYSIYYVGNNNQVIIANYDEKDKIKLNNFMNIEYGNYLEIEDEYELEASLIYEFAESAYDDFYDFIRDLQF